MRGEEIETMEDVRIWVVEHDTRINKFWADQHEWNEIMAKKIHAIERSVNKLLLRVAWFSGAAAAVGSLVGMAVAMAARG